MTGRIPIHSSMTNESANLFNKALQDQFRSWGMVGVVTVTYEADRDVVIINYKEENKAELSTSMSGEGLVGMFNSPDSIEMILRHIVESIKNTPVPTKITNWRQVIENGH